MHFCWSLCRLLLRNDVRFIRVLWICTVDLLNNANLNGKMEYILWEYEHQRNIIEGTSTMNKTVSLTIQIWNNIFLCSCHSSTDSNSRTSVWSTREHVNSSTVLLNIIYFDSSLVRIFEFSYKFPPLSHAASINSVFFFILFFMREFILKHACIALTTI